MKKHNIISLFSLVFFIITSAYSQNYKTIIDNKLFESKTTSFSKSNDGTIYAGRYSYGSKLDDSSILRTINNGQTWEKIANFPIIENSPKIFETIVKVDPNNSDIIFIYFISETEEIYSILLSSNDGGKTFEQINIQNIIDSNDLGKVYSIDLHIDLEKNNSAYLLINGMNNSKIYKYTDDKKLTLINIDCNYFDIIISIAISRQNPNTLYASGFSCFYKSTNAGISWEMRSCNTSFDNSFKKLKIDPIDDNIIYGIPYKLNKSSNSEIVKLTNNGGYTWDKKYSESYDSKEITAQGVTIDIDSSNHNRALVTFLIIDSSKDKESTEYQKSKIIETTDRGQILKLMNQI